MKIGPFAKFKTTCMFLLLISQNRKTVLDITRAKQIVKDPFGKTHKHSLNIGPCAKFKTTCMITMLPLPISLNQRTILGITRANQIDKDPCGLPSYCIERLHVLH